MSLSSSLIEYLNTYDNLNRDNESAHTQFIEHLNSCKDLQIKVYIARDASISI